MRYEFVGIAARAGAIYASACLGAFFLTPQPAHAQSFFQMLFGDGGSKLPAQHQLPPARLQPPGALLGQPGSGMRYPLSVAPARSYSAPFNYPQFR